MEQPRRPRVPPGFFGREAPVDAPKLPTDPIPTAQPDAPVKPAGAVPKIEPDPLPAPPPEIPMEPVRAAEQPVPAQTKRHGNSDQDQARSYQETSPNDDESTTISDLGDQFISGRTVLGLWGDVQVAGGFAR